LLESGVLPTLHAFAMDPAAGWRPLAGLRVHAPVEPLTGSWNSPW